MHALIVEDEFKTAAFLTEVLREAGWSVDAARDGAEGLRKALAGEYALVLLDVMLPGRDGWSILSALRGSGKSTPVLFLTARDAVAERVRGLDLGADDYLVKPFDVAELLARVRSIQRRGTERTPVRWRVADLEIDLLNRVATRAGVALNLTPKEFALLAVLARYPGEVVGRLQISKQVWNVDAEGASNVVDVAIKRLRQKVDAPFKRPLIHTVYGVGYVLEDR